VKPSRRNRIASFIALGELTVNVGVVGGF